MYRYLAVLLVIFAVAGCRPTVYPPKPPGYFRIDTPATHKYLLFDRPGYPYSFEYPANSLVENDTVFLGEKADNPYWINIYLNNFGGVINITYKQITEKQPYTKLAEDAWGLSFFHHEKADFISEKEMLNENGVRALLYIVGGNAASRYQFTATDSTSHFIRGALYFDVTPNADSLKPATDFLEQDIKHMLSTLKWK